MNGTIINIEIVRHPKTGLLVAFSDDLKGLFVHARSVEELDARVPIAIKDILEANGHNVGSVTPIEVNGIRSAGFEPSRKKYQTREPEAA